MTKNTQLFIVISLVVVFPVTLPGCGKKNSTCFECRFGMVNGSQLPDREVCTDGEDPDLGEVRDEQGNAVSWYCERK